MIPRLVTQKVMELSRGYPALAITGPTQSGKSWTDLEPLTTIL